MIYRRGILSVSRGKHNRGIEYSFPPFKTSIPIIAFRGHSYRFRPNPKAIVLGGNEPFFIGERRLVAGVIHRQIKASLLANVQTDKAWCFFTLQEIAFLQSKKRSARMRTATYKVDAASGRRRRENVPRHIFFNSQAFTRRTHLCIP